MSYNLPVRKIFSALAIFSLGVPALAGGPSTPTAQRPSREAPAKRPEKLVKLSAFLDTERGLIVIQLYPRQAPRTVENFVKLARQGFYNGVRFHRVVPGFVAQAGDPRTRGEPGRDFVYEYDPLRPQLPVAGTGGPGYAIAFEPNPLRHLKGSVGMARTEDPDSAGSQFYICLAPQPALDGNYVVFGRVVRGMERVEKIQRGDRIRKVRILEEKR